MDRQRLFRQSRAFPPSSRDARFIQGGSLSQVDFLEGGVLSPKRLYLEVRRDWLTYQICMAPFGTGFFASSRMLMSSLEKNMVSSLRKADSHDPSRGHF